MFYMNEYNDINFNILSKFDEKMIQCLHISYTDHISAYIACYMRKYSNEKKT